MLPYIDNVNLKEIKEPFYIYKPEVLKKNTKNFLNNFSGEAVYAVKTNPCEFILKEIYNQGIKSFDVASINEVKLIRKLFPHSNIYFMNPVKPGYSIKEAYCNYDVRDFSLDSDDELKKIITVTNSASDLNLHLRISVPNDFAKVKLTNKFGVDGDKAQTLLKKIREKGKKIGVSFHTGSQCMKPDAYKIAIKKVISIVKESGIDIDFFNIGGGFPSSYPGMKPPLLREFFQVINYELSKKNYKKFKIKILSEPGRTLVYNSMSLIVRVDLRKKNYLFINDGIYGSLNNAGKLGFRYTVDIFDKKRNSKLIPFSFYGPTCDSNDFMKGPFFLPDSVSEGDYIEIKEMGAYSITMRCNFNGFYVKPKVFIGRYNKKIINSLKFSSKRESLNY